MTSAHSLDIVMYEPPNNPKSAGAGASAPPTAAEEVGRQGLPIEPVRVLSALRRGRRTMLKSAIVSGVVGVVLAKTVIPREYATEVTLLVTPPVAPGGTAPDATRHIRTVADSLKLPSTLDRVRRRVGSDESLERIGKAVQIETVKDANLLVVRTSRKAADEAARLADAAGAEFTDVRLEDAKRRLSQDEAFVTAELEQAIRQVDGARERREAFRKEHGLSDVTTEIRVALEQSARHSVDSETSSASVLAESARLSMLEKAAAAEPPLSVIAEQQITPEAQKLADVEALLAAETGRLDDKHPRVLALRAQVKALRAKLASEREALVTARTLAKNPRLETLQQGVQLAASEKVAAARRGAALAESSRAAKQRVAELAALQGPLAALDAEVSRAQTRVDELELRRAKVLEATRAPQADVAVLAPAVVPLKPVKATGRMVALASPLAGAALAAAVSVLRALRGLRATSATEVAFWTRLPVLAAVRGASGEALSGMRADFGAHARHWTGRTLVLAMDGAGKSFGDSVASLVDGLREGDGEVAVGAVGDAHGLDAVRREVRAADRVVLLLRSDRHSVFALSSVARALGGTQAAPIAVVLYGLVPELVSERDRVGELSAFLGAPLIEGART